MDDYIYQKRTKDPDKSVENQRKYDHQAREYALQNQGLTDYGNAIHNNEQFFYEFMDKNFDKNNPLNQMDLDRALGYETTLGTTKSCLLASLYNGYAFTSKNGINGSQIIDTLFDNDGTFKKASDGKSYIDFEIDKKTGVSVPFIKISDGASVESTNFSWTVSSSIGLSYYLQINPAESYSSIANDYSSMKYGLYGILKMENANKPGSFHFVYVDNYTRIDSLPSNRNKPDYIDIEIMEMRLRNR